MTGVQDGKRDMMKDMVWGLFLLVSGQTHASHQSLTFLEANFVDRDRCILHDRELEAILEGRKELWTARGGFAAIRLPAASTAELRVKDV